MKTFRPMLAARDIDLEQLKFPLYVSPKLDGIRAIVWKGHLLSRKLKLIPNRQVRKLFEFDWLEEMDGELICGSATAKDVYRKTVSAVMTHDTDPSDVQFHIFDVIWPDTPYHQRLQFARDSVNENAGPVKLVPQTLVKDYNELMQAEQQFVTRGYEGAILRSQHGGYKFGRSTQNEGHLMKLKRFKDSEAVVVGFEELMHNNNEQKRNELGYSKRSSHKANQVPGNTLGSLTVEDRVTGVRFSVGSGFTDDERKLIWETKETWLHKIIKYKFLEIGVKDAPRHPVFLGWRDPQD